MALVDHCNDEFTVDLTVHVFVESSPMCHFYILICIVLTLLLITGDGCYEGPKANKNTIE